MSEPEARLHYDAPQICPTKWSEIHTLERLTVEGSLITAHPCGHRLTPEQAHEVMNKWAQAARCAWDE